MPGFTQTNRRLSIDTPLGQDVLLLTAFSGGEKISRPFRYQLELLSETEDVAPVDIVGKSVTWSVQSQEGPNRYFNGVVSRFAAGGMRSPSLREYRAEVVPLFQLLACTRDCRIFQNKTVVQIVEAVFQARSLTPYETSQVQGNHPTWDYCVQYRESDFDFVCRLLEQEGIFYFFRHEQGKHTLVLADQKSAYADCVEKEVDYTAGSLVPNYISRWEHGFAFRSGKWTQADYNFETPSAKLQASSPTLVKVPGVDKYELYDYPGKFTKSSEATPATDTRMEAEEAQYEVASGASTCPTFSPGCKFTLKTHDCQSEAGKEYVLTAVEHSATDRSYTTGPDLGPDYQNTFTCIPAATVFRPERSTPKPVVQGPQTAVVVGPSGEEIYTDKYGRIKVQFFWDRQGKKDENSSCWMRVAENWAGKNWGTVFLPRIGQEVLVDFLEGDPDRPIITGRVYNADQLPPYALPANQTQSGVKSRSTKDGTTENFNELRFEDKKDSEEIYFHAEKNFNRVVENNDTLTVGSDKADDGSQTIEIYKNRTETVKTGDEKVTIEQGNRTHSVKKDDKLTVEGTQTVEITGDQTITIKQGNRSVTIQTGNDSLKVTAGSCSTEAGLSIELKVGSNSIKIDESGITLNGIAIKIEGQATLEAKAPMTQVNGDATLTLKGGVTMIN